MGTATIATTTTAGSGTTTTIGEALTQTQRKRKIGTPGFRFNAPAESVYQVLCDYYRRTVETRGRELIASDDLNKHLTEMARCTTEPSSKFGIVITGNPGNGKTTLATSLAELIRDCTHSRSGTQTYRAKEIARICAAGGDGFDKLCEIPIMIIDDLGEEPKDVQVYGNVVTPMVDLIEERYARRLYTVFTTNLDAKEIAARYGRRVSDRLREMVDYIVFGNAESYR